MKPSRGQWIASLFCLLPLAAALFAFLFGSLSANPIQDLTLRSGRFAMLLLLLSLACTPLKNLLGLTFLLPVRKTLGLFAFLYAALHFLIFAGLDFEFNPVWIVDELRQKPFLRIGLAALLLLLPLALTSFRNLQAKMADGWRGLHRLVYPITALAIWHIYLAAKDDFLLPLIYTILFIVFMLLRIPPLSKISISGRPDWLRKLNRALLQ